MRRMHVAARDHQWGDVETLDQMRCSMLEEMEVVPELGNSESRAALVEIMELDNEVINEIERGMDLAALMTDTSPQNHANAL